VQFYINLAKRSGSLCLLPARLQTCNFVGLGVVFVETDRSAVEFKVVESR
jgi:hypothetical protein